MNHPNEEQLILYHYRDVDNAEEIGAHLNDCASCRREYEALSNTLSVVSRATVPAPPTSLSADVWQRLRTEIERPPQVVSVFRRHKRLWIGAALAASLLLAFALGRHSSEISGPSVDFAADRVRDRILLVAVGDHFNRSEMMLIELANADASDSTNFSDSHDRIQQLIADNRLYRQAANREGDVLIAGTLESLERLLLDIVNQPQALSPEQIEQIRRTIRDQDLIFKVQIIESRLNQQLRTSAPDSVPTI